MLKNGSRVGVIGGGPAGALFAHFALRYARASDLYLRVTLFDGKSFAKAGPPGCNMCAGVIAAGLVAKLQKMGVELPEHVVQREIDGYWLETGKQRLHFPSPLPGGKIFTVYRGNGPRGCSPGRNASFDDHLLQVARDAGAEVIPCPVVAVSLPEAGSGRPVITFGGSKPQEQMEVDLVVCAFGLNSRFGRFLAGLGFGYRAPAVTHTYQAELPLPRQHIEAAFGRDIVIYSLDLPDVKFSAIIPKRDFVTVTLVGEGANEETFRAFLGHPSVAARLPGDWSLPDTYCHCRPPVSVSPARHPYTDRLVVIGDASHSRLYKNGLESAYMTAQAAAHTAVFHGISRREFDTNYLPVCKAITRDGRYGKLLFWLSDLPISRKLGSPVLLRAAADEQRREPPGRQPINQILWSMFTGDRPYRDILRQMLSPAWVLTVGKRGIRSKSGEG